MTDERLAELTKQLLGEPPWITIDGVVDYECRWCHATVDGNPPREPHPCPTLHKDDCLYVLYHMTKEIAEYFRQKNAEEASRPPVKGIPHD